eukprot:CAMPEP_0174260476 /NCGR_PEP_ID=MMETSP0439-20130205/9734_1 /TAXON_ID=0 /ORGANISM="Stereomyxa ramosa, Strain Chinc5" /LENGTH=268 /DNA_ID=CAMNT_0015344727 /DNA_START=24 /DNA_END=830 /DNA_ORIENTATION=+
MKGGFFLGGLVFFLLAALLNAQEIKFFHALPGEGAIDLYLDGRSVFTNLGYGNSTDYLIVDKGSAVHLTLYETGEEYGVGTPIYETTLDMQSVTVMTWVFFRLDSNTIEIGGFTGIEDSDLPTSCDSSWLKVASYCVHCPTVMAWAGSIFNTGPISGASALFVGDYYPTKHYRLIYEIDGEYDDEFEVVWYTVDQTEGQNQTLVQDAVASTTERLYSGVYQIFLIGDYNSLAYPPVAIIDFEKSPVLCTDNDETDPSVLDTIHKALFG